MQPPFTRSPFPEQGAVLIATLFLFSFSHLLLPQNSFVPRAAINSYSMECFHDQAWETAKETLSLFAVHSGCFTFCFILYWLFLLLAPTTFISAKAEVICSAMLLDHNSRQNLSEAKAWVEGVWQGLGVGFKTLCLAKICSST